MVLFLFLASLAIAQENQSPQVTVTAIKQADGLVTFSPSAVDYDGTIVSCTLNFGDGLTPQECVPSVSHVYIPGSYQACIDAIDDAGSSASACLSILVSRRLRVRIQSVAPDITITALDEDGDLITARFLINGDIDTSTAQTSVQLNPGDELSAVVRWGSAELNFALRLEMDGELTLLSASDPDAVELLVDPGKPDLSELRMSDEKSGFLGIGGCASLHRWPSVPFLILLMLLTRLTLRKCAASFALPSRSTRETDLKSR
jgi:hypothetical protein